MATPYRSGDGQKQAGRRTGKKADMQTGKRPTGRPDTRTPAGRLTFHLFACIAEFERARIVERTHEGIAAARRRGRKFGRPKLLSDEQARLALRMIDEENVTLRQVAEQFRISPGTLCTRLKKLRDGGAAHPQQKRA